MLLRVLCLSTVLVGAAQADSFDDLLKSVRQHTLDELAISNSRLAEFTSEKKSQEQLLKSAEAELAGLLKESERLNAEMDANEKLLADTEEALQRKVGDLGELFGAIRQVAGELNAELQHSMVSVAYPERMAFLEQLAQSKELPATDELEHLWFVMLQEMGETGKTREDRLPVTQLDGTQLEQNVIRIGAFNGIF